MSNVNYPNWQSSEPPPEDVVKRMGDYVDPFVSAIGLVLPGDDRDPPGFHFGTGQFIELCGVPFLLTCEHVAEGKDKGTLVCTQFGAEYGISVANKFASEPYPVDVAASPFSSKSWSLVPHNAKCIDLGMLASRHMPVEGEYLYVYGFPGQNAKPLWGEHHHQGIGVFTQECDYDPVLEDELPKPIDGYHIFLAYNPEYAFVISGSDHPLSRAGGLSGSVVWNTRYKEITSQGQAWQPEDACVTGIVWGNSTKAGMLIATPIEHIHPFLQTIGIGS